MTITMFSAMRHGIYADEDSRRKKIGKKAVGYSDEKIDGIIKSQFGEGRV